MAPSTHSAGWLYSIPFIEKLYLKKFVNLLLVLCFHTYGHLRAYGEPSGPFETASSVRQVYTVSPINFVVDGEIMRGSLEGLQDIGIELRNDEKLRAYHLTCLYESAGRAQRTLRRPPGGVALYGMCFGPKCEVVAGLGVSFSLASAVT